MAKLDQDLRDTDELFTLARGENDFHTLATIGDEAQSLEKTVEEVEFRRMFANPLDPNNCFIDIQAGQGGTEAKRRGVGYQTIINEVLLKKAA